MRGLPGLTAGHPLRPLKYCGSEATRRSDISERIEKDFLMTKKNAPSKTAMRPAADYSGLLGDVVSLLETAHRTSARAVNAVMTATYWEIGRRIVEVEQQGSAQAEYGDELIKQLAADLTARFGRGFGWRNVYQMRAFHLTYQNILHTVSAKSGDPKLQPVSGKLQTLPAKMQLPSETGVASLGPISAFFPLPWSHYVKLLSVEDDNARRFYESEALRSGWSVRQLDQPYVGCYYCYGWN
jgi:hypothetical protein